MDRSLQERLVGAAVLVALGVWLIPWVLDGSAVNEERESDRVALKLPVPERSSGNPIRRETIDLRADRGPGIKAAQGERSSPVDSAGQAAAAPVAAESLAVAQTPEVEDPEPAATAAPERSEPAASPPVAASTAAQATEDSAAAAEILAASPVAGWMVQLGSFSDAGNARRQAQRIGTYGHDARIYEFSAGGGRRMFRVRLGPVETRERAEAEASALAAHGFVAQLVAPE